MNPIASLKAAQTDGQLLESTAQNLTAWLEADLPAWAVSSIQELVDRKEWSELNDRFYRYLEFGTGGMRGRTIGVVSTAAEKEGEGPQGTPGHAAAMDWLERELGAMDVATRRERFRYPGWRRGEDRAEVVAPFRRPLRAAAAGYSTPADPFEAEVAVYEPGAAADTAQAGYRGRVLLLPASVRLISEEQDALVLVQLVLLSGVVVVSFLDPNPETSGAK